MQGTNRSGEEGEKSLLYECDPGSELRLGREKGRAKIINGMKHKQKSKHRLHLSTSIYLGWRINTDTGCAGNRWVERTCQTSTKENVMQKREVIPTDGTLFSVFCTRKNTIFPTYRYYCCRYDTNETRT